MKKSVFTLLAIAFLLVGNATKVNAQYKVIQADDYNYNHVRENVLKGDEEYRSGAYTTAEFYYQNALRDNGSCGTHKYISDEELNRKLDDCKFAIQHNGKKREQYEKEQSDAATKNLVSAIANAFSKNSNNNTQSSNNNTQNTNTNTQNTNSSAPVITYDTSVLNHGTCNGISFDANYPHTKVTKVEKTANATIVHFELLETRQAIILKLDPNTYVKDRTNDQKYVLTNCNGIYTDQKLRIEAGDSHDFTLTFPAVSENCHEIDVVDPSQSGYKFYHITF